MVRNTGSVDLQDYPIGLALESSGFDFSRAANDGADIGTWDAETKQPVSHWIEAYDSAIRRGLIWIKLPTIAAQQTRTIWLTSGSTPNCAQQVNDGLTVFPFFSDVGDIGNWKVENQITLTNTVVSGPLEIAERRVIEADGNYNSTPGLVEASSGDWVLAYRKGLGHVNSQLVILRRSQDQGATWSPEVTYFDTSGPDPSLARTPGGDLLLEFVKKDPASISGAAYSRSLDNGLTWGPFTFYEQPVSDTSAFPTRFLNDGSNMYAAGYGPSKVASGSAPFLWTSTDDGLTWVKRSMIRGPGEPGMNETAIAEPSPGTLIAISRADDGQNTYGHFSRDMGQTWEPAVSYTSQVGILQLPQLLQVGPALILFGREVYFFTTQLVAYVSYDGGQTFQYGTVVDHWLNNPIDGGYSWPIPMADGRVFVVFYTDPLGQRLPNIESAILQVMPVTELQVNSTHIGSQFNLARATRELTPPGTRYALELRFQSHDTPGGNQFAVLLEDSNVQPPAPLVRWELPSESAVPAGNSGFFSNGQFMPIAGTFNYDQPYRLRSIVDEDAGQQQAEVLDQFGSVIMDGGVQLMAQGSSGHADKLVIGNNTPRRNTDTLLDFVFIRPLASSEPQVSLTRVR